MTRVKLDAVEISSGRRVPCQVDSGESAESCEVSVSFDQGDLVRADGYDYEEALVSLRNQMEARGLLLLCNRFRRDAYVTPMSRQMSRGLSCYLVSRRRPVRPADIVDCLGPAGRSHVVPAEAAAQFIARWQARPPIRVVLRWYLFGRWSR